MTAESLDCFAVAAPGLEPLVAAELRGLGLDGRIEQGGVAWEGDLTSLYRANLWLRTATRVLVRIGAFRARTFQELERRGAAVPWARIVQPGSTVAFRVTAKKSRLYHTGAVTQRLEASLARAVRGVRVVAGAEAGEAEEGPGEGPRDGTADVTDGSPTPPQLIVVRLARDELTLSADSSGAPLYQRGYRQAVAKAPLRETLAAALLMSSGWRPGESLVDPFCGSGTIPLEGALMAAGIAPGLASADRAPRAFAFTGWEEHTPQLWLRCIDDALKMASNGTQQPIVGADRDAGAIAAAESNAQRAGLGGSVGFEQAPVSGLGLPSGDPGWVVTNPPYGLRIGEEGEVRRLYAAFGRTLRERGRGWKLAMLSPDHRLDAITAAEAGVRLEERLRTRNGGIAVRVVASERAS